MYCKNCGSEIADGSKFCSNCGSPVLEEAAPAPDIAKTATSAAVPERDAKPAAQTISAAGDRAASEEIPAKPIFEEFKWDVSEYPDYSEHEQEKTEDINFDWNANPAEVPDAVPKRGSAESVEPLEKASPADFQSAEKASTAATSRIPEEKPLSAAERIDKFYTFSSKNEEFQKLLDREYEKVKSGNAIEHEMSEAKHLAEERFQSRPEESSMERFLEKEGVVKPYQPKAFESDVLQRIEAQEAEKEAKRLEEEARLAAIEEARKAAEEEAKRKAEEEARAAREAAEAEARRKAEEEARFAAEVEARRKAEEEARLKAEAEAEEKRKAEEEAARLAELARVKAEEEARAAEEARKAAEEEAKRKAEEEERIRAEEEAKRREEAEAKVRMAEEARLKAEADLRAAQEAARIRAQQEARIAAEAEAQFKANQERQRLEAEEARIRLENHRQRISQEANQAAAKEEVEKVIAQTARMRDEEAAKIKATVAAMRGGAGDSEEDISKREIREAHQATRNQINEMTMAREAFFAELEGQEAKKVTGRETMLSEKEIADTRVVNKKAVMDGVSGDTIVASRRGTAVPENDDEFFDSLDRAANEGVAPEREAAHMGFKEEMPESQSKAEPETSDLLAQFEDVNNISETETPETAGDVNGASGDFNMGDTIYIGSDRGEVFKTGESNDMNATVVVPSSESFREAAAKNDFDNYGNEEAADYINRQRQQREDDARVYGDDFYDEADEENLSKKELKQREKERKRREKERAKEEKVLKKRDASFDDIQTDDYDDEYEEGSGKGRIALKIVLVVLIVILAVELAGMAIRILMPQSAAAEFIDNQLNKVIQLVTGDDTEYSVIAAAVRTEPMEDKTDLIKAQEDKNVDGNIKVIVYSSDLGYDQERDSKVSDLVLSQPMTQVEWGRDEDNYPIYYDEQVVGQIIAFESSKMNLMNKGDESVLKMINPESDLYDEISGLKNKKADGAFEKLEIGEIRQTGSNYCVWVRETIGNNTTEKVYSMFPDDGFTMKMAACYTV